MSKKTVAVKTAKECEMTKTDAIDPMMGLKTAPQPAVYIEAEAALEALKKEAKKKAEKEAFLKLSIEQLEISVRTYNCLKNANIRTVGELVEKSEGELLRTKNFGRKSLNEMKEILAAYGLG